MMADIVGGDGRQTPYRLPKRNHAQATTKRPVTGIYVPRVDDQDYYKVDFRDVTSPVPANSEVSISLTKSKPVVDKMAVFYKPGSGCRTHCFRSKRSAYVEHLIAQIDVNTARIAITEFPDVTNYAMPRRSESAPLAVRMPSTKVKHEKQRVRTSITQRVKDVRGQVARVTPKAPPKMEPQHTGLQGSPKKERSVVERHLPEMPALKVRMTWNTPEGTPRPQSPETNALALVPFINTEKEEPEATSTTPLLAITGPISEQPQLEISKRQSNEIHRSLTWEPSTIDASQRSILYHPDQDVPPPQGVAENVIRKRQFLTQKSREKTEPGWKNEQLTLGKEKSTTSQDFQDFFKVNRPSRLHPRGFGMCGHVYQEYRRVMTTQSTTSQCIMCRCGLEWNQRALIRGDTLPAI